MKELLEQVARLGKRYHAQRVMLYGSRARGDHRENSDIDIAVYGMPAENRVLFEDAIENLPTLLDFDIAYITERTEAAFARNITKDGVILMDKFTEKYGKLCKAVERLREAADTYRRTGLDEVRDGVIQRFEFCTELAWKTLREKLIDEGYTELNSPKAVLRQAYAAGLLVDENAWLSLLGDRNLTSHIYDEETAAEIYGHIQDSYILLLGELVKRLA